MTWTLNKKEFGSSGSDFLFPTLHSGAMPKKGLGYLCMLANQCGAFTGLKAMRGSGQRRSNPNAVCQMFQTRKSNVVGHLIPGRYALRHPIASRGWSDYLLLYRQSTVCQIEKGKKHGHEHQHDIEDRTGHLSSGPHIQRPMSQSSSVTEQKPKSSQSLVMTTILMPDTGKTTFR